MSAERTEMDEKIAVKDLQPGHMIDLQNDLYADPDGTLIEAEFELALVSVARFEKGKRGSADCVTIYTDMSNFNAPPDHLVRVCGFIPDVTVF